MAAASIFDAALEDDQKLVHDDGDIYQLVSTEDEFRDYCKKECVRQLCNRPGPDGFEYMSVGELDQINSDPDCNCVEMAKNVLERYNSHKKENMEFLKLLKLNWAPTLVFMTIKAMDAKTGDIRIFELGLWDYNWDRVPFVGRFKDVTSRTFESNDIPTLRSCSSRNLEHESNSDEDAVEW